MRPLIARGLRVVALMGLVAPLQAQTNYGLQSTSSAEESTPTALESSADTDTNGNDLPETGFQWGLGVGFGLPLGNADGGATLFADVANGSRPFVTRDGSMAGIAAYHVPLTLDLGYRVSPAWWLGLRPHIATGGKGEGCPSVGSCHFTDARLSALVKYHLDPSSTLDPWLGVSLGWEWLMTTLSLAIPESVRAKQALSGPLLEVLGGLAFDVGDRIRVGPFAAAAVGRYVWNSLDCSAQLGCPGSYFVRDGAFHAWLNIGVSGEYGP